MESLDNLIALPLRGAARVAGVSSRRLTGWAAIDLVKPAVERRLGARTVRLYGFRELTDLAVIALLLQARVPLRHIREVLLYLHPADRALSECRFAIEPGTGRFFFHDGSGWVDSRRPAQLVLPTVIPLEEIRTELRRRLNERSEGTEKRRGALASKEVFAGTRIPVATVLRYIEHGFDNERIKQSFPGLTDADIELARERLQPAA